MRIPLAQTIAVTGATGFIGRYIVEQLTSSGHVVRCWYRPSSNRDGLDADSSRIQWVPGALDDEPSTLALVTECDAVVHSAFWRPGNGFRGAEGNLVEFARQNVLGSIRLMELAKAAGVGRFIQISTCAVHEEILSDRPLDEAHPLWPLSHYGAHKAALEKFVHSYGLGHGYAICALRPTGVYGMTVPPENSKWYALVQSVVRGETVECHGGGKEVHAADVAKAIGILLEADNIVGQSFNCYDRYISEYEVAMMARDVAGTDGQIIGASKQPKHQIETAKLRNLGMAFGGEALLRQTVRDMVDHVRQTGCFDAGATQ